MACRPCNEQTKRDEEYFLLSVAAEASETNASARRVLDRIADQALSGENRRTWMTMRLVEQIRRGDGRARENVLLGSAIGVKADPDRLCRVSRKIARGLHALDHGSPVPGVTNAAIAFNPPEWHPDLALESDVRIGPEFSYRRLQTGAGSLWGLTFYETITCEVALGWATERSSPGSRCG